MSKFAMQTEPQSQNSKNQTDTNLKDILDWQAIQECFEEFNKLVKLPIAIIDIDGNFLAQVGIQDICAKYHRINPEAFKNCYESDINLTQGVPVGSYKLYRCHNNMYDAVTPLVIEGRHLGNLLVGQFLFADELLDLELYREQARKYGFDEREYLSALQQVPVISREIIDDVMSFLSKFADILSTKGYSNVQLSRSLAEIKILIESLKKSEGKYRLLVENQTDLFVKNDSDGNFLYASPSYCQLFGVDEKDLLGKPYSSVISEENLSDYERAIKEMLESPYTCFYEERVKTLKGWRWLQWTGKTVIGENGEIEAFIGNGRDITEKKNLEKELIAKQAQQSAMVANILDVLMIADENLDIKYVSANIQKYFGWTPQDLYGKQAFIRIYDDDKPRLTKMINEIKSGNSFAKTGEFRYLVKDGAYKDVEITAVNLIQDTYINGYMINFHDITEHKRRENEIKYLSYRDALTGLYNRTFFEEEIKRYAMTEDLLPFSVIMGDVNGLKIINDGFGHEEGDTVLKRIAQILLSCCRANDVVCRIGGDEFCVLLPRTKRTIAEKICGRIYKKCVEINTIGKHKINLSISLGYETKEYENDALTETIKRAESIMYRHKLLESRSAYSSIISAIKATMYEKSEEMEKHSERTVDLTVFLGKKLGLAEEQLNQLELLATLHDIGKMSIDRRILNKPGKLTASEWLEVKKHPEAGYRIALASPELVHIADYILYHHERWDGSEYPQGLKGEDIPFLSRIVAVVDAYDAITNGRSYKEAQTKEYAIDEIKKNSGTQFDPDVVKAFLTII